MSDASPVWQGVILLAAVLYLLWETRVGWKRGVVRSALFFAAFVLSGVVGVAAGQGTYSVLSPFFPQVAAIAALVVGTVLTLLILLICVILAALVFKKTGQQKSATVQLFFGQGGAFFGLLTALVVLWGAITLIRVGGTMLAAVQPAGMSPSPAATALAKASNSLELGPLGGWISSMDVVPESTYENIQRMSELTQDPEALMRFVDSPPIRRLSALPQIRALMNDPSIIQALETRNMAALMSNPALLKAASDPALQKEILSLDLPKALDYALPPEKNPPSHPSARPSP